MPLKRELILDRVSHRYGAASDVVRKRLRELRAEAGRREPALDRKRATGSAPTPSLWANERAVERELLEIVLADPSRVGEMVVPTVTGTHRPAARDVSLISCGGQASIPALSSMH